MARVLHSLVNRRGRPSRKVVLLVAGVLAAAATAAGVLAYFTATGHGAGTAHVTTVQNVTISAGSPSAALFPGHSGDVALSIANPNGFPIHVGSLETDGSQGTGGFAVDAGHAACDLSALSFTTQTNGGNGWTVPANGSLPLDLSGSISMAASAVNACQGASFTVYVKAGP